MKKFFVLFFLLLILAAAGFVYGWVSLFLPEQSYGVVFTKTGGWKDDVVRPGEFVWMWERLIPTNLTLHRFPSTAWQQEIQSSGMLPSGTLYAAQMEGNPDFSYTTRFFLSFRLRPESLPSLVQSQNLNAEELDAWYQRQAEAIMQRSSEYLQKEVPRTVENEEYADLEQKLQDVLESDFPDIEILTVSPKEITFPDIELYRRGKELYFSVLDAKETAMVQAAGEVAREKTAQSSRMDRLKELGELLTEYPVLLEYFALDSSEIPAGIDLDQIPSAGNRE